MRKQQQAFTLIELMVTLAVLAIVLAVAIPSFNTQIQNNRSLALGEDFTTALSFARSEAVKRGGPVTLCASNAAQADCGNDWDNGWLIAVDAADETAAAPSVDSADDILRVWDTPPDNAVITVQRTDSDGSNGTATSFIRFTGMGTLARINNEAKSAKVVAHTEGCTGESQQTVVVGVAGLVRVSRTACPTQ